MGRWTRLFLVLLSAVSCRYAFGADRDVLWSKVSHQCLPHYVTTGTYHPCALVDLDSRYVLYKVDSDDYQYLLMPTDKILGIEDERLLSDDAPNYWYLAWQARPLLGEKLKKRLKERDIALTVNASNARSQDQLHIHISCLAPAVRLALSMLDVRRVGDEWAKDPIVINHHSYYFKKMGLAQLKTANLFRDIRAGLTDRGFTMAYAGAALVNVDRDTFLVLASPGSAEHGVSAEEIQEHQCSVAD